MDVSNSSLTKSLLVRTHFVRGRNALLARANFGELYVDYYLHQGQHGYHHAPEHDGMLKETLAALALHCASRPWNEAWAWTLHFQKPLLNLFVTGDNRRGIIVGQASAEDVKDDGRNIFYADVARERAETRRSSIEFEGSAPFRVIEQFYVRSEQRPARYFQLGPEDFAMISAQPDCDLEWLAQLDDKQVGRLTEAETLSPMEERAYEWGCGCSQDRMFPILASIMGHDPTRLFGVDDALRMSCPRCGARHTVTREAMEAFVSAKDSR